MGFLFFRDYSCQVPVWHLPREKKSSRVFSSRDPEMDRPHGKMRPQDQAKISPNYKISWVIKFFLMIDYKISTLVLL